MKNERFSIKSRSDSFRYAFNGLVSLLKYEHNSRIHLFAAIMAIIAAIVLKVSIPEWCLLFIVIGLVFAAELINTSIESLGDEIDSNQNEKIKIAKDLSAGAVFVTAIISAIVGGFIFIPKILSLF